MAIGLHPGSARYYNSRADSPAKTLVAWVQLANLEQRGGSAMTIQSGDQFDGIVFGEHTARRWMAGSDFFNRTEKNQEPHAPESAVDKTWNQIAIVYTSDRTSIYRNGESYASYDAKNIDLLNRGDNMVVFGLRHVGATSGSTLRGAVDDARIYDRALTVEEIRSLRANVESSILPFAWWTFEKGARNDRMGRFSANRMRGGATFEDGCLVLESEGASMVAASEMNIKKLDATTAGADELANYRAVRAKLMSDRSRPVFHLTNTEGTGVPGDPNGAIYWKGRYHLHYIINENGCAYAHVSSVDMVHWRSHPITLSRATMGHEMFSGTCFLNREGRPTMIYHGWGSGQNVLSIAEDDALEQWSRPIFMKPEIRSGQNADPISHWDPDAWFDGSHYYSIYGGMPGSGKPPTLMKSDDMIHWNYLGLFLSRDMPGVGADEDISCPNFFKIGNKYMLLCISHKRGCRYYLGDWKNEQFTPDVHQRMNWSGIDYFAPESLLTPDGRRVMWAWCVGGDRAPLWGGILSLPRELSLATDGTLRIQPLRELELLRYNQGIVRNLSVDATKPKALDADLGEAFELSIVIRPGQATGVGVRIHSDSKTGAGIDVTVDPVHKLLQLGDTKAPLEIPAGEDIALRIFVDHNCIEVFANDRQAIFKQHEHAAEAVGVRFVAVGGAMEVVEARSWRMQPSNPW